MSLRDTVGGLVPRRRKITNRAGDQAAGMTLAELGKFVQDCHRANIELDAQLRVNSTITGKVLHVSAEGLELVEP